MADAKLIIHHHRDDERWARRIRRVAAAYPDLLVGMSGDDAVAVKRDGVAPRHIHVCSPSYAEVPRALDWGEHVALIVAGEPGASAFEGASDEECLPPALAPVRRVEARADRRRDGASAEAIACEAVAVSLGVNLAQVRRPLWRQRGQWGLHGVGVGLIVGVFLFGANTFVGHRNMAERAATSDAAVTAGITALDAGDDAAVYAALASVRGVPSLPRAKAVFERAMLETRLLADLPAPAPDISGLSFLPGGVIAATSAHGGAWLVDPGAGVASEISAPSPGVVARLSPAGDRLWTARPGVATRDETGSEYVPLTFVDIDLAQAEVVTETAIRTPVGRLSEGAISPDGALFAADIGPGAGAETLVAAFRRGSQALAGVLRLPSDRASVRFVGADRILATINPPGVFGDSPGLYLWRVGADAPMVLRPKGTMPVCPSDVLNAEAPAIRAAQERGELATPQVLASPNGREIALLLPRLGRGACLLRWRALTGEALDAIDVPGRAVGADILAEGGPYLIRRNGRPATVLRPGAPAITLTACRTGAALPLSPPGARADTFLCADGTDGVVAPPSGVIWRRHMHVEGVTVAATGQGGRLATAGRDGRIRIWDGVARSGSVDVTADATFHVVAGDEGDPRILTLSPGGTLRLLATDGQAAGPVISTGLTEPDIRVLSPSRAAVLGVRDATKVLHLIDVTSGEVAPRSEQQAGAEFMSDAAIIVGDGWATQITAGEDGQPRKTFLSIDGARTLADIDVVVGARVMVNRDRKGTVQVRLSGRGAAHDLAFQARSGDVRLSPTGDVALLRIEGAAAPHDDEFYLLNMETGSRVRVADAPEVSGWFDFSETGAAFAIKPVDPTAPVPIFATSSGRNIGEAPGGRAHPVWSPVGDVLTTAAVGLVTVTEIKDGRTQFRCVAKNMPSRYLAFSHDGSAVITSARTGGVAVLDAKTCTARLRAPDVRVSAPPFAPAPDTIWVPTLSGASILSLGADPAAAKAMVTRRARALAATR